MIGQHVDNLNDIEFLRNHNINIVQIFLPKSDKSLRVLKKYIGKFKINIAVHAPYTINIANNWDEHSHQIINLIDEIERSTYINAKWFVLHIGTKPKNISEDEAYNNMLTSILYINHKIRKTNINILLETAAGEGNDMLYSLEDFAEFMKKINLPNFGICVDTCHIYAAGYRVNRETFNMIMELFGPDNVKLVHLNDSLNPLGSRKDRHIGLGNGFIGLSNLIEFKNLCVSNKIPAIMELSMAEFDKNLRIISHNKK